MSQRKTCKRARSMIAHRVSMRAWANEQKKRYHQRYMAALNVFNDVYARPYMYTMYEANAKLTESGNI